MTTANEQHLELQDEFKDRFSSDLQTLKASFGKLREDVSKILDNTLGTGKSGAGLLKDRVEHLRHGGVESVEKIGHKIGERPLLSAAIALGIGFVLAKLITTKR
jgi:hypothetical protein